MEHSIKLRFRSEALPLAIAQMEKPAFSRYELARVIWKLYETKSFNGVPITGLQRSVPDRRAFLAAEHYLLRSELLKNIGQDRSAFYVWAGTGERELSKFELVCCFDPFSAISHLSAMEWHALTNRIAERVFFTTPSSSEWQRLAREKMNSDLGNNLHRFLYVEGLPSLQRINFDKVGKRSLNRHETNKKFSYVKASDLVRVTSIGRTYLDMLRAPLLCGGLANVFDAIRENGKRHFKLISNEFNTHGNAIDKVRMGFLLETLCAMSHPILDEWATNFASRGGSRKLDAQMPYEPRFSSKWQLSINAPIELEDDKYD